MLIKHFCRIIALAVCAFTICMQTPAHAVAEINTVNEPCMISEDYVVSPYADVIVLKTRILNGVVQYRHWNETRGYWVEDDWIDLP